MPVTSDRDRVRLKIGDTDSTDPLLSDDEVDVYTRAWPGNVDLAAADAAEAIAAKFSRSFNFATDGQTFNRRERVLHYMDLSSRLRKRGGAMIWPFIRRVETPAGGGAFASGNAPIET
jgi:hypothetical protein